LAQSGYSTTPDSPLGAVGRAGIMTQKQQRQGKLDALQKQLIEAQIGRLGREADPTLNPQRRVHSAQPLDNGNIGYLDAFTGEVVDTGVKSGQRAQVIDVPGKGQFIFDPIQRSMTEVATESVVQEGLGGRKGAEADATRAASARDELPAQIAKDEEQILEAQKFLGMLERGEVSTGPIVGNLPPLTTNSQLFEAFSGKNIIASISEATFGSLSEGEREFIRTVNPNRKNTEEANMDIIRRKVEILERAVTRQKQKLSGVSNQNVIDFNDLPE